MPTYKKNAEAFTVSVWVLKNQQGKTTIPKPLLDLLNGNPELRGEFILKKDQITFIPIRSNTEIVK